MATSSSGKPTPVGAREAGAKPAPLVQPAAGARAAGTKGDPTLEEQLFQECFAFDFFQAVRLLERLAPDRQPVGRAGFPAAETIRFLARQSLDFPPSSIYELNPPGTNVPGAPGRDLPMPAMTVAFMGLTGPSGILPRHYTEMLLRVERETKGPEKQALRAWLDLFNHRLIALFYRAWEKYHFFLAVERREFANREPDAFTRCLYSLMGLGTPSLRQRLRVACLETQEEHQEERVLARIEDLGLLRYSGFFAHRPRCAVSLETFLSTYLNLPVQVVQFQGQWLRLEATSCSTLGQRNNNMGLNVVVGDRVWDVQGKIRIRLGPLSYEQFQEYLPDRSAVPQRKAIFLVAQLVRLYVGPEVDVEIQLILRADDVPACRVGGAGSRLGWNTWSRRQPMPHDAEDAVFQADERVWL